MERCELALTAGRAIGTVPDADRRALYYDLIMAALSEAARKAFDMLPEGYQWQSDVARAVAAKGKAEGRAEGKVEGKAEAVLDILDARGLAVTDADRGRILACTDLEMLRRWTRRAATIASTAELFAD